MYLLSLVLSSSLKAFESSWRFAMWMNKLYTLPLISFHDQKSTRETNKRADEKNDPDIIPHDNSDDEKDFERLYTPTQLNYVNRISPNSHSPTLRFGEKQVREKAFIRWLCEFVVCQKNAIVSPMVKSVDNLSTCDILIKDLFFLFSTISTVSCRWPRILVLLSTTIQRFASITLSHHRPPTTTIPTRPPPRRRQYSARSRRPTSTRAYRWKNTRQSH